MYRGNRDTTCNIRSLENPLPLGQCVPDKCKHKPDIYRCISFSCDWLGFYAENQITVAWEQWSYICYVIKERTFIFKARVHLPTCATLFLAATLFSILLKWVKPHLLIYPEIKNVCTVLIILVYYSTIRLILYCTIVPCTILG